MVSSFFTLPTTLLLLLQLSTSVCGQSSESITGSVTGTAITGSVSDPGSTAQSESGSGSSSATPTSSASFPSLSGYPICVTECLQTAVASANCSSIVLPDCYCGSSLFTSNLTSCISSGCADQLPTTQNLTQQFCQLAETSTSASFSVTSLPVSSSSSSVSVTSSSSSSTPTSSAASEPTNSDNASRAMLGRDEQGAAMMAMALGLFGALMGVYFAR